MMGRKRFMRGAVVAAVLGVALAGSNAQALVDSPCVADPGLCAAVSSPDALAGCKAIAVMVDDGTTVTSFSTSAVTANVTNPKEFASTEFARGDVPPVVHASGIESHCQAEVGSSSRFACGESELGDFRIDLRPLGHALMIEGHHVSEQGCTRSTGLDPNSASYERLEIIVPAGCSVPPSCGPGVTAAYIALTEAQNRHVPLAPGVDLFLNERFASGTACEQNQGTAVRVKAGEAQVIIGWLSTGACA